MLRPNECVLHVSHIISSICLSRFYIFRPVRLNAVGSHRLSHCYLTQYLNIETWLRQHASYDKTLLPSVSDDSSSIILLNTCRSRLARICTSRLLYRVRRTPPKLHVFGKRATIFTQLITNPPQKPVASGLQAVNYKIIASRNCSGVSVPTWISSTAS